MSCYGGKFKRVGPDNWDFYNFFHPPKGLIPYLLVCLSLIWVIMIRYKVNSQQHARAGTNIQHVIYDQLARAGQNM